jgi:hypothetical protein
MSELTLGAIVFACVFGGALGGMTFRSILPEHHLAKETEDAVRLGMGVIATMSALVVGLLLASAKASFDTKDGELKHFAADLILLDRNLARYGPETKEARDLLRRYTVYAIDSTWPEEASNPAEDADGWMTLEEVQERLRALTPRNDAQRWLRERALLVSGDLSQTRWLLRVQAGSSVPMPFLLILVFWLTMIFTSFGVFAPGNATAITTLLVGSLSIAGAIFLILEMAHAVGGLIHLSSAPVREALALLGQ